MTPKIACLLAVVALLLVGTLSPAAELVSRKGECGTIVGYKDTPLLPATGGKYHVHDPDRPEPKYVDPGPAPELPGPVPSDAIVLFDGQDLSAWEPTKWKVADGYVEAGGGSLVTRQPLGSFQLHIEWMAPATPATHMMSRGNSGVLLMGLYEIQIFDSHPVHDEQIYPDGQAASIYGQTPPLVNACRKPGQWQSFDIVFTAPEFDGDKLVSPGVATVCHNGVLVHNHQQITGPMTHRQILPYRGHAAKLPLALQGHGSPVRFRNIWVRPLGE
ncbi:MAG: DUF1080 domain-containing protein [Candidatus Nealsonbacteria bacterium]|nr:DUF1080 domain-containing protein [Candidatus Nealsonbacteria bacterium]